MNVPSWAPLSQITAPSSAGGIGGRAAVHLLAQMPVAVLSLDGGARVHYANAQAEHLLGRSRESLVGRVFTSEQVAPEDRWRLTSALQQALVGETVTLVLRVGRGESVLRLVEAHLLPGTRNTEVQVVLLDLTEQSEVEAALRQSETLYNTFLEQSPVGLLHLDAKGTITFENRRFREIVGDHPDQAWSGLSAFRISGLDSLFGSAVKRLLNAQIVQDFTVRYAPQGRRPLHLLLNGSPIRREDGSISGAILMVQDVTQQRDQAEQQALRERFGRAEAALREAVLDNTDESAFLREAARIFAQTVGADRAALLVPDVARDTRLLTRVVWGEAADALTLQTFDLAEQPEVATLATSRDPVALPGDETRVLVPFFGEALLEGTVLLERFGDEPLLTPCNTPPLAHLTRLFETLWSWLRTTNRYRLTVATIEDALVNFVFEADGTRRFLFLSPQAERMTGYAPQRLLEDAARWQRMPLDQRAEVALRAHDTRLRAGEESEVVFRARHAEGSWRWLREHAVPHRDDTGVLSVVGILSDVTGQKRAEQVLLEAKSAAEAANRDKTAFIATLSHEIRTPLGTVNGFADLLARELEEYEAQTGAPLPPQIDEFVGTIRDRAQQILALVGDIFDLANLESGTVRLAPSDVNVNDVVTEIASQYAPELSSKSVALQFVLDPTDPRAVADPHRLAQVVDQLLSNAVKFTAEGAVTVRTQQHGDHVIIEVEDTGVGMSEAFLDRLFTPFLQEDQRINRDFEGVGIGLSLARRLITLQGGDVTVTSRKGEGTTFRVLLPRFEG